MEEGKMPKLREEELQDVSGGSGGDGKGGYIFDVGASVYYYVHPEYGIGVVKAHAGMSGTTPLDRVYFEDVQQDIVLSELYLNRA